MSFDPVNRPKHYNNTSIEPIDVIDQWLPYWPYECGFALANAVKYISRCGLKGTLAQDLRKAAWYIRRAASKQMVYASDYGHTASLHRMQVADAWAPTWPGPIRGLLTEALLLIGQILKSTDNLEAAAEVVERAAYLAEKSEDGDQLTLPSLEVT